MNELLNMRSIAKLLAALLICQPALYAQQGERDNIDRKRGSHHRAGEGRGDSDRFAAADLNDNGVVDFSEFSQIEKLLQLDEDQKRKLYDFLDQNGDGDLLPGELKPAEPMWKMTLIKRFSKFDKDSSDDISLEEFLGLPAFVARGGKGARHLFSMVDADANDAISLVELQNFKKAPVRREIDFSQYDEDESGGLDRSEYSQLPMINKIPEDRIEEIFMHIDMDDDGEISADELQKAHERRQGSPHRGQKPRHR